MRILGIIVMVVFTVYLGFIILLLMVTIWRGR